MRRSIWMATQRLGHCAAREVVAVTKDKQGQVRSPIAVALQILGEDGDRAVRLPCGVDSNDVCKFPRGSVLLLRIRNVAD